VTINGCGAPYVPELTQVRVPTSTSQSEVAALKGRALKGRMEAWTEVRAAKPVVQAEAKQVGTQIDGLPERLVGTRGLKNHERLCRDRVGKIHMEIFGLHAQAVGQSNFDAAADGVSCRQRVGARRLLNVSRVGRRITVGKGEVAV